MRRCINDKHSSSQIQLFLCRIVSYDKLHGWGEAVQGSLSSPPPPAHPPWYQSKNYFANSTYFKPSECGDVSLINIIQCKFSCFLCRIVSYAKLQGWGAVYLGPHPPGSQRKNILLILLILNHLIVEMYQLQTII